MFVVQQIHARYEKRGRGGAEARARATLPLALPLPSWSGSPKYVCHDVTAAAPDYVPVTAGLETADVPPRHARFLRFDDGVHWRAADVGMPPRPDQRLLLEGRGWLRIRFNGRTNDWHHGEFSHWVYLDATLNIGWFEHAPPEGVFVESEPDRVMDLRAPLW